MNMTLIYLPGTPCSDPCSLIFTYPEIVPGLARTCEDSRPSLFITIFIQREAKSPSTKRKGDYTVVIHSGQKASPKKDIKKKGKAFGEEP